MSDINEFQGLFVYLSLIKNFFVFFFSCKFFKLKYLCNIHDYDDDDDDGRIECFSILKYLKIKFIKQTCLLE